MDYDDLRRRTKARCDHFGFSYAQVGRLAGYDRSHIYRVLTGEKRSRPCLAAINEAIKQKCEEAFE